MPNRVIGSNERGGLEVIQAMQQDLALARVPVMLLSAIPEAQQEAAAAGAVPGIGKDVLETDQARTVLSAYVGADA